MLLISLFYLTRRKKVQ
ncbi:MULTISPECIES: hypothetical protein [Enterococcus]